MNKYRADRGDQKKMTLELHDSPEEESSLKVF